MGFNPTFRFKQFGLTDRNCAMKIGTDGVLVGLLAHPPFEPSKVADIGSGCGIISLMLAQRFENIHIDAVEIDDSAVNDLTANIQHSPWPSRIAPIEADFINITDKYDLIVSNPPFFTNGQHSPSNGRALARHADSLSPLSLVDFASNHLNDNGLLALIVPTETASKVISHAAFNSLTLSRRVDISTSARRGITRAFLEFSSDKSTIPSFSTLCVNSDNYNILACDFYLHL